MGVLPLNFAKNWLYPTVFALLAAVIGAVQLVLPEISSDGLGLDDWPRLAGTAGWAAFGFIVNLVSRYGGKKEPWIDPAIPPTPQERREGL